MAVDEEGQLGAGQEVEAAGEERPPGDGATLAGAWAERHRVALMLDAGTFVTAIIAGLGALAYFNGWMWMCALLGGVYLLPMMEARRAGLLTSDPRTSQLPRATLTSSEPGDWRLLLVVGS